MKKTAIALAIAGLAVASVVQAAPQANTYYAGARVGSASFHEDVRQFADTNSPASKDFGTDAFKRKFVTYGVYGGYQITDYLAAELGYDDFGRAKYRNAGTTNFKHTAHGASVSLKASYPIGFGYVDGLDAYARVGAALVRSDYKGYHDTGVREHSLHVSPLYAAGLEYSLPSLPELALRVEYQWLNKVGRFNNHNDGVAYSYSPSISSVTAGLSYRFGQGTAPVAPEVVNKTFTLNSDVTFAFAKSTLKPEAASTLDGIYSEIAQVNNASVAVAGYADRIGKDAANLKLSQRRAETVANYLVSKGVAQNAISATGYGEANPVTGNTCDAVKGKKALIACLAPDRRVEVSVQGNKQATM
ncbi:porin OmpA [Pasteurella bettyae]|uniref:porin OmpA n=1 Tax=Pasteurella bettyae TaxID=752 RepID=UPI003D2A54F7